MINTDNSMIVLLGGILVVCVMFATCMTSSYCDRGKERHGESSADTNESTEDESTLVQIKVSDLRSNEIHGKMTTGDSNRERSSIDSNRNKEQNEIARDSVPRLVPVKVYTYKQHGVSGGIWSSKLKDQLQNIANSSSEVCGTTRIVRAQIERNPTNSNSFELIDGNHDRSIDGFDRTRSRRVSVPNHVTNEKARKLSSAVIKKYKSLKKIIMRSQKPLSDHVKSDGAQGVPTLTLNQCSPLKQSSTTLRKNVSTSTRLSVNGSNVKTHKDEVIIKHDSENDETMRQLRPDSHQSNTGAFQEMVSFIRHESPSGKSICDLKIRGLAVDQSQLLELFRSAEGVSRSASIVTTEEASVLTIKFNRRRESNEGSRTKDTSFYECPLAKLYRSLPQVFEDFSISKLF